MVPVKDVVDQRERKSTMINDLLDKISGQIHDENYPHDLNRLIDFLTCVANGGFMNLPLIIGGQPVLTDLKGKGSRLEYFLKINELAWELFVANDAGNVELAIKTAETILKNLKKETEKTKEIIPLQPFF